jgi:hypothetical protein
LKAIVTPDPSPPIHEVASELLSIAPLDIALLLPALAKTLGRHNSNARCFGYARESKAGKRRTNQSPQYLSFLVQQDLAARLRATRLKSRRS